MTTNICIVGLRRSGTTIFWRTFRQDERLLCFDEPFNPRLYRLLEVNPKSTWDEFIALERSEADFGRRYAPLQPGQEAEPGLDDAQSGYLSWLLDRGRPVLADFVRLTYKLDALRQVTPNAVVVHLHRDPASFASSHLLPSGGGWRRALLELGWRRWSFWRRRGDFNRWQLEEVIGRDPSSAFGRRFAEEGYDAARLYALPAVARLLAYWCLSYEVAERTGRSQFGDRFVSVRFEDFCRDPRPVVNRIYETADLETPDLTLDHLRPASGPFRPEDERWNRWLKVLGMDHVALERASMRSSASPAANRRGA